MKRFISLVLFLLILFSVSSSLLVSSAESGGDIAIVFTHDLHSHIDPFMFNGESSGGFARIKTVIDAVRNKHSNTLVLDAGDFSMGTLYQTAFSTQAIEYRLLGELGFDATTFGNHEFDYGFDSLTSMISVANEKSSTPLPPILCSNINAEKSGLSEQDLEAINVRDYSIFEKGKYTVAVFGLMGRDAAELSSAGGLDFDDFISSARDTVKAINNKYDPDVIVCLSHSGTGDTVNNEDVELAKKVPDIDVIISGHTHTLLAEPIIVGDTIIASCGEYGQNVGTILLDINNGDINLSSYNITSINASIPSDDKIESSILNYKEYVLDYLSEFGFESPEQVIAKSPFDFPEQSSMSDVLAEQPLGNLISDSYIYSVKQAEGDNYIPIDVATVPVGVIRSSIDKGDITVSQIFEISSLGIGEDGLAGYPLCSVYLYGSELWTVAEIDASVSGIMSYAQLYSSGLHYSVNTNRMFLNRVYDCWLVDEDGNRVEIVEDKLYRVVSGITSAEMLGTVKDKSFGLLELTPKDKDGNPIADFSKHVIRNSESGELKEWVALANYLGSFTKEDDIPTISTYYSQCHGRKNINDKFSFGEIFCNWNYITWVVFVLVNIVIIGIVVISILVFKKFKKKKRTGASNIDTIDS